MKKLPSITQKCLLDLKQDTDLFFVDEDISLFKCACELMTTLKSILCGSHRTLRFYQHCDQKQEVYENSVSKDYAAADFVEMRAKEETDVNTLCEWVNCKAADLVFGQALNNLNYFNSLGGFTALIHLLRVGNEREPED